MLNVIQRYADEDKAAAEKKAIEASTLFEFGFGVRVRVRSKAGLRARVRVRVITLIADNDKEVTP